MVRFLVMILMTVVFSTTAQSQELPALTYLYVSFTISENGNVAATYSVELTGETDHPIDILLNIPVSGDIVEVTAANPHSMSGNKQAVVSIPDFIAKPCDLSPLLI